MRDRIRKKTTVRHTKCGRMRGMVVGEGGRSSGVLLYRSLKIQGLFKAYGQLLRPFQGKSKFKAFSSLCEPWKDWLPPASTQISAYLTLPEALLHSSRTSSAQIHDAYHIYQLLME